MRFDREAYLEKNPNHTTREQLLSVRLFGLVREAAEKGWTREELSAKLREKHGQLELPL